MRTYQHSGIVPMFGAIKALALGSAVAVCLGTVYAFAFYYIPFVYLNFILAICFGCGIGGVVGWAARSGNIRNTPVTVAIAGLAACVGIYAEWGSTMYAFCPIGELPALWKQAGLATFNPIHILDLMLALFEEGSWGLTDNSAVTGWPLVGLWITEAALIVGLAMITAHTQIANRPFCEACQDWITGETPHLYTGEGSEPVWAEVQAGSFDTLADTPRATGNEPTYVRLKLHVCDTCEASNYLTITRCANTTDAKGNPKTEEKDLITNLAIDRTQVELIRAASMIAPTLEAAQAQGLVAAREWTLREPAADNSSPTPIEPPATA